MSEPDTRAKSHKTVKITLLAFVAASIAAAAYKTLPSSAKTPAVPAETAAAVSSVVPPEKKFPVKTAKPLTKVSTEAKTAIVYYFYTNTRCSSCKTIEAYAKEAVERNFTADYKGWKVIFKGVNIEEEPGRRFVQDYWLNTKSVVVQKFSGDKPIKWVKLDKVWQLLDDKDAFINYVTVETHSLLDEK